MRQIGVCMAMRRGMIVLVRMMVVMRMIVERDVLSGPFLFAMDFDGNVRAVKAAAHGVLAAHLHARQAERVEAGEEVVGRGMEFEQRRHQHVAGGAHVAFEIERLHSCAVLLGKPARCSAITTGGMMAM